MAPLDIALSDLPSLLGSKLKMSLSLRNSGIGLSLALVAEAYLR